MGVLGGDDWGSRSLAAAFGYGSERQVLLPYKECDLHDLWIDLLIFHEYVHQADYEGLLSRALFDERLEQMRNDPDYADVAFALDNLLDSLKDKPFGQIGEAYDDGRSREGMAYLMQFWAGGCLNCRRTCWKCMTAWCCPIPSRASRYSRIVQRSGSAISQALDRSVGCRPNRDTKCLT